MFATIGIIDGWEVRRRADSGFGVYDDHGMISGPYGSAAEAIGAALKLPRSLSTAALLRDRLRREVRIPAIAESDVVAREVMLTA